MEPFLTSNIVKSPSQVENGPLKIPSGNWHKGLYGVAAAAMLLSNTAEAKEQSSTDKYPLPKEIPVLKTTFPTHWATNYVRVPLSNGTIVTNKEITQVVRPAELDLSQNFMIETPRYKIVRAKDWGIERLIGHPVSCIAKVIFFDWNAGLGLDANRTKAAWSMVENNPSLNHVTVRINHNGNNGLPSVLSVDHFLVELLSCFFIKSVDVDDSWGTISKKNVPSFRLFRL